MTAPPPYPSTLGWREGGRPHLLLGRIVVALDPQVVLRGREQQLVWKAASRREVGCRGGPESTTEGLVTFPHHDAAGGTPGLLAALPGSRDANGSVRQPIDLEVGSWIGVSAALGLSGEWSRQNNATAAALGDPVCVFEVLGKETASLYWTNTLAGGVSTNGFVMQTLRAGSSGKVPERRCSLPRGSSLLCNVILLLHFEMLPRRETLCPFEFLVTLSHPPPDPPHPGHLVLFIDPPPKLSRCLWPSPNLGAWLFNTTQSSTKEGRDRIVPPPPPHLSWSVDPQVTALVRHQHRVVLVVHREGEVKFPAQPRTNAPIWLHNSLRHDATPPPLTSPAVRVVDLGERRHCKPPAIVPCAAWESGAQGVSERRIGPGGRRACVARPGGAKSQARGPGTDGRVQTEGLETSGQGRTGGAAGECERVAARKGSWGSVDAGKREEQDDE